MHCRPLLVLVPYSFAEGATTYINFWWKQNTAHDVEDFFEGGTPRCVPILLPGMISIVSSPIFMLHVSLGAI